MANDLNQNPRKIGDAATELVRATIRECLWIGATTTHILVLTINGVDISFTATAAVDGVEKHLFKHAAPLGRVDSFIVKTIPSGDVYVFVD